MLAQLIPQSGGTPITIDRDLTLVGRNRHICDLHLNHSSVSKVHCLIAKTDGLLFIRDLGSSNGTRVNGQRVSRGALLPGDTLSFANIKFKVFLGPDAPAARTDQTEVIPSADRLLGKKPVKRKPPIATPDLPPSAPLARKASVKRQADDQSDSDVRIADQESVDELEIIE